MYRALYRKYRPVDFSDVCGQPQVVRTLKNQLIEGRLSHAYLFTGSRGTGKTSCAKILAKAVNCLNLKDGNPCNECDVCKGINDETILDVTEIDAASNNGVDDIRELRDNSAFTPAVAKYRVYIIDEVHMLSGAAFNALLKTLEEPPEHVIFILATTEVHKLPATILSRCQRFDFHRISPEDIADRIEYVASQEGFTVTRDAAVLIGKLSDGAMRDALSLLDVCSTAGEVTEQTVLDCAGLSGRQHLFDLLTACFKGDSASALSVIDDLYAKAKDFGRLCSELSSYLRDLMLVKSLRKPENLLKCPSSELDQLKELAASVRLDAILHAMDLFQSTGEHLRAGAERRTAVETAVIKLCDPSLDTSPSALLRRISALESGSAIAGATGAQAAVEQQRSQNAASPSSSQSSSLPYSATEKSKPLNTEPSKPSPSNRYDRADSAESRFNANDIPPEPNGPKDYGNIHAQSESAPADAPQPTRQDDYSGSSSGLSDSTQDQEYTRWNDVVAALGTTDRLLRAVLEKSRAYVRGEYMLIYTENESFRGMINSDTRHRNNLKAAIQAVTGRVYKIGPYKPAEKKITNDDPLDKIIAAAKENGVPDKETP